MLLKYNTSYFPLETILTAFLIWKVFLFVCLFHSLNYLVNFYDEAKNFVYFIYCFQLILFLAFLKITRIKENNNKG